MRPCRSWFTHDSAWTAWAIQPFFFISWKKWPKLSKWKYGFHVNWLTLTVDVSRTPARLYSRRNAGLIGCRKCLLQMKSSDSNVIRGKSWTDKGAASHTQAKPDLHQKKLMVCAWCSGIARVCVTRGNPWGWHLPICKKYIIQCLTLKVINIICDYYNITFAYSNKVCFKFTPNLLRLYQ